jgi:Flp pilus assembly protein TadD
LQGKYTEAETIYRQTLRVQETVLGKYHPGTLRGMNNLAVSLHQQGRYTEAEAMYQETYSSKRWYSGRITHTNL